jgi:hypothetical protein
MYGAGFRRASYGFRRAPANPGSAESLIEVIEGSEELLEVLGDEVVSYGLAYGMAATATTAARRWFNIPAGAAITTVGGAYQIIVPLGFTRIIRFDLLVTGAGSGAVDFTWVVTRGDLTTETDTAAAIVQPATFSGIAQWEGSAPVTPGQTIRIANQKSGAAATQATGIGASVILSRG